MGQLVAQSTSVDAREDAKAARNDWSRGTTILSNGLREYVKTYRQVLAQRLGVGVPELAEAIKKESGKARTQHQRILSDYEALAEREALTSGADPRSVNPRIRAKFGNLVVRSDQPERLSEALGKGRDFRDQIFEAAYQSAANGVEPLDDQKVQVALSSYLDHRQRITQTIDDYIENWPMSERGVTSLQWIGFGFLLILILFLFVAFVVFDTLSSERRAQLGFLSALCAGFAGTFFTGSALINVDWTGPAVKVGLSGTAGFTLFIFVFIGYRKFFPDIPNNPGVPNNLLIDIKPNWKFEQAIEVLGKSGKAGVELVGFNAMEKDAELRPQSLQGKSVADLMLALRGLTNPGGAIRRYGVSKTGSSYKLTVK